MTEATARLASVSRIKMVQQNAMLEAVTGGAMPNTYMFSDFGRMYQPMRSEDGGQTMQAWGEPEPWPMLFVEEQMGECCSQDCCCRVCCQPR